MRKVLTVSAVAATVTIGVVALGTTANAATQPHQPKSQTALSVRVSAAPGQGQAKDTVTGSLTAGPKALAGETVTLDVVSHGRLVKVGTERTGRNGTVSFTVAPKSTTAYKLVFNGTPALDSSQSKTVTIRTR